MIKVSEGNLEEKNGDDSSSDENGENKSFWQDDSGPSKEFISEMSVHKNWYLSSYPNRWEISIDILFSDKIFAYPDVYSSQKKNYVI